MQLKAILIDDEQYALTTLEAMLHTFVKNVIVVGKATNAVQGIKEIHRSKPHLVFLDINMPGMDGFEMLELLDSKLFKVIITSGNEKHALKALKMKVADFLVKPIDVEELEKTISTIAAEHALPESNASGLVRLMVKQETFFIRQDEIRYIRAERRYSEVISDDGKYLVTKNLGEFEQELNSKLFFRIHRSYLVNRSFVKNVSNQHGGFVLLNDGTEIEISRRKKTAFLDFMKV